MKSEEILEILDKLEELYKQECLENSRAYGPIAKIDALFDVRCLVSQLEKK